MSGEVGQRGVPSPTQRQPPSPSNPSSAWSPLHFPGRAMGLADLQAAPLPEVCAGEGWSSLLVVSAGSAAVGAWEKHFQGGVCAHRCGEAQREERAGSWVPLLLMGCRGFLREQRRGSQRQCPRIQPMSLLPDSAGHAEGPRFKGKEGPRHTWGLDGRADRESGRRVSRLTSLTSGASLGEHGVRDALTGSHHGR